MWIARDNIGELGDLLLFVSKPTRVGGWEMNPNSETLEYWGFPEYKELMLFTLQLNSNSFMEQTWETEPTEVTLVKRTNPNSQCLYLARDKDGNLWIYTMKPTRVGVGENPNAKKLFYWAVLDDNYDSWSDSVQIDSDLFPEQTWEMDPTEVELIKIE